MHKYFERYTVYTRVKIKICPFTGYRYLTYTVISVIPIVIRYTSPFTATKYK